MYLRAIDTTSRRFASMRCWRAASEPAAICSASSTSSRLVSRFTRPISLR